MGFVVLAFWCDCSEAVDLVAGLSECLDAEMCELAAGACVARGRAFDTGGARPACWVIRPPRGGETADWGRRFEGLGG